MQPASWHHHSPSSLRAIATQSDEGRDMTLPRAMSAFLACAVIAAPVRAGAAKLTTLYSFSSERDGADPNGVLLAGGLLYGTTSIGGRYDEGTLYSLDPVQHVHTILFDFAGDTNGQNPNPVMAFNGLLYGTTEESPGNTLGTVFTFDTATNALQTIYAFVKNAGGVFPVGALAHVGGTLYGVTYNGGTSDDGTLFALNPATGATTFPFSFGSHSSGKNPGGIAVRGGILFGEAEFGGIKNHGIIFKYGVATGRLKVLYRLHGGAGGFTPSGLSLPDHGALYGVTAFGGKTGFGILYKYELKTKTQMPLYSFTGGADGGYPGGDPVPLHGLLYGITSSGGQYGQGTIFSFNLSTGSETVLYSFTGAADGGEPSSLIYEKGTFYGTTAHSQQGPLGTIFAFKP
jgi:uncharacterized repeat protein (TIGR03803 family)